MAKNCAKCSGRRSVTTPTGQVISQGQNGVFELSAHQGCFTPYNGRHRADNVFVIGFGTEHEALFLLNDKAVAFAYAKAHQVNGKGLVIRKFASTTLCSDAVAPLYGE